MSAAEKVWLITGCTSGFGREFVGQLVARGEKVIATARDPKKIEDLKGESVETLQLDVTDKLDKLKDTINKAVDLFGRIDVVLNNAGFIVPGPLEQVTPEESQKQFDTNVFGLLNVTRAVLPHFRHQKSGMVIIIGSYLGWRGLPGTGLYCSSKFTLEGIAESLHGELKPFGITTLLIEPGLFRTPFLAGEFLTEENVIPDYQSFIAASKTRLASLNGNQQGDPKKLVTVVIDVIKREGQAKDLQELPVRLPLGSDAYQIIKQKCEDTLRLLEQHKTIIHSTDF